MTTTATLLFSSKLYRDTLLKVRDVLVSCEDLECDASPIPYGLTKAQIHTISAFIFGDFEIVIEEDGSPTIVFKGM